MIITAILVDGGFYQRRAQSLWGNKTPQERAKELWDYCLKHLSYKQEADLYRIFYYDCPPSSEKVYHPLLKKCVDLSKTPQYQWMSDFHEIMRSKRKVALRMGRLSSNYLRYSLSEKATKKLCRGAITAQDLTENDFTLSIVQKGVDMKMGIDIASMAYKHQVNQIVMIAGDSDFVPVIKLARREGIDVILDPMHNDIASDLNEHIDGLRYM